MIIVTAPSGAGKTTIVRHLLGQFAQIEFSVSATTRDIRPYEKDGVDYHFKSREEFHQLIKSDELAEWQEVYEGRFYGTLRSEIQRIWSQDHHIIFDIDVKGAVNLQMQYPDQCLSVFIKPPNIDILLDRLKKRKTETTESLKRRIKKAKLELTFENLFDRTLINDDLATALAEAESLILTFIYDEEE